MIKIRHATTNDISGIAEVELNSWHATYKKIIFQRFLKNLTPDWSVIRHMKILYDPKKFTYIAENEYGQIIGFATGGVESTPFIPYKGELYSLYLLNQYQGKGIGKQLLISVAKNFQRHGVTSMMLYVLKENHTARQFYKKYGGVEFGESDIQLGEVKYRCIVYSWLDLNIVNGLLTAID